MPNDWSTNWPGTPTYKLNNAKKGNTDCRSSQKEAEKCIRVFNPFTIGHIDVVGIRHWILAKRILDRRTFEYFERIPQNKFNQRFEHPIFSWRRLSCVDGTGQRHSNWKNQGLFGLLVSIFWTSVHWTWMDRPIESDRGRTTFYTSGQNHVAGHCDHGTNVCGSVVVRSQISQPWWDMFRCSIVQIRHHDKRNKSHFHEWNHAVAEHHQHNDGIVLSVAQRRRKRQKIRVVLGNLRVDATNRIDCV